MLTTRRTGKERISIYHAGDGDGDKIEEKTSWNDQNRVVKVVLTLYIYPSVVCPGAVADSRCRLLGRVGLVPGNKIKGSSQSRFCMRCAQYLVNTVGKDCGVGALIFGHVNRGGYAFNVGCTYLLPSRM